MAEAYATAYCPRYDRIGKHSTHLWEDELQHTIQCPGTAPSLAFDPDVVGPGVDLVPPPDMVNHPPHYNAHPTGTECIDIVEHFNFNVGNAIKYLWRQGLKEDSIQDLKKAEWYIKREIERRTKDGSASTPST